MRAYNRAYARACMEKIFFDFMCNCVIPKFGIGNLYENPLFFIGVYRMKLVSNPKPYGVDDLQDFNTLLENDEYYPFSKDGQIIDEKAVSFFLRAGYLFNPNDGKWYLLDFDGLYRPIRDEKPLLDIMIFLDHHARKNGNNISINNQKSIYERLKAVSKSELDKKQEHFVTYHDDYCLRYDQDFIPVQNGLIHPETMELLPHCGYFVYPNVLGFNYKKLTYDEIRFSTFYDDYLGILPDNETLELFLWWVGMVLFSDELPRIIMFLYGQGGTGKTTLSLGLSGILTSKGFTELNVPSMKSQFFTSSFVGKKLVIMDEMSSSGGLLDDSLFKKLTGGNPVFTIQEKYKNPRNEVLTAKTLMMGNSYPSFVQDSALLDRMFIIPCFKKQDSVIREIVTSDDALNWLFNAAYYYYVEKHPHKDVKYLSELKTPVMIREQEKYRESDSVYSWLRDYLGTDKIEIETVQLGLDGMPSGVVFKDYQQHAIDNGKRPLSNPKFIQQLNLDYKLVTKPTNSRDEHGIPKTIRLFHIEDDGGIVDDGGK